MKEKKIVARLMEEYYYLKQLYDYYIDIDNEDQAIKYLDKIKLLERIIGEDDD